MNMRQAPSMRRIYSAAGATLLGAALLLGSAAADEPVRAEETAQVVHPRKVVYQDQHTWPATAPAAVTVQNFRPFRAVYERRYVQGGGPNAGEPRTDQVIVSAEAVAWDGLDAIMIHLIDSGIAGQADTNARTATMILAREDLHVLFEVGPIPGTAKDYFVINVLPDRVVASMVTSATPSLQPRIIETSAPGFGPTTWAFAALDLNAGDRVRLDPALSPGGNPLSPASFGRMLGRETFTDLSGRAFPDSSVIETVTNMANERSLHVFVRNEPPYYLGTASWNMDTDRERNKFVWLKDFMYLDEENSGATR